MCKNWVILIYPLDNRTKTVLLGVKRYTRRKRFLKLNGWKYSFCTNEFSFLFKTTFLWTKSYNFYSEVTFSYFNFFFGISGSRFGTPISTLRQRIHIVFVDLWVSNVWNIEKNMILSHLVSYWASNSHIWNFKIQKEMKLCHTWNVT